MKDRKEKLHNVMTLAWQFVRKNGYTMSEALKVAWLNIKVRMAMTLRIVKFYFLKIDGTTREAYGTLKADLLPNHQDSGRKKNDTVQVYFDTEKQEWRCFKKANLISIA